MKNVMELARYIRFQLSQLGSQNKNHEFEHLARQFARLRICENILPATGPVGAGGDQGRDFETFRTYLASTPIATSSFIGNAGQKKLVFGCSLEKGIEGKIRSDVRTICAGPEKVDGICYFCEADLPVGRRHGLQKWAQDKYKIELEILDGQALSEQLTDLDLFWIAEEFLDVPAELYPRSGQQEETYEKYRHRWLERGEEPGTYADFFQVKYGLRRATFHNHAKPDLLNWLKKVRAFLGLAYPKELRRRATYEVCVASLRGLNNLTQEKNLVEDYLSELEDLETLSDIQDAVTLLSYCSSAQLLGYFDIEEGKLRQWTTSLITMIEDALQNSTGPGFRSGLLQIRGQAALLQFQDDAEFEARLASAFGWWLRLLDEVDRAPLFPLESFADILTTMTEFVGEDKQFLKLTRRTDELLSDRSSGYVAAEKCRDRAVAYYDSCRYLLAIKQLHQSKIKWFSAETLRESLLSMMLLSQCYQRIGLVYPAKYYASGVASLANQHQDDSLKVMVPRAMFLLCDCCYQSGEWLTFGQIARWALTAHIMYEEDPLDIEKHGELQRLFVHTAVIRTLSQRLDHELFVAFDEAFDQWPLDSYTRERIVELSSGESSYWHTVGLNELWAEVQRKLSGRPFSDMGRNRTIRWKALGIDWAIEFENEWLLSSTAEELASTLQIILADIADLDLVLLPTKVLITTHISDIPKIEVEEVPSNEVATWRVRFPQSWLATTHISRDFGSDVLPLAVTILAKCSTLGSETFFAEVEQAFAEGLTAKTFAIRPYAELYTEFLPEGEFAFQIRRSASPLLSSLAFEPHQHEQLAWISTDGPGYSRQRAEEFLINRYTLGIKPVRLTLPNLLRNEGFRRVIVGLRREGYLDWKIQTMVAGVAMNFRLDRLVSPNAPPEQYRRLAHDLMFKDEASDDPQIPVELFEADRLLLQWRFTLGSIATTWGLKLHQGTPDFLALEKLLDVRYHNSDDDIEHEDLFAGVE